MKIIITIMAILTFVVTAACDPPEKNYPKAPQAYTDNTPYPTDDSSEVNP